MTVRAGERAAEAVALIAEPGDGQMGLTGLLGERGVDGNHRGRSERLLHGKAGDVAADGEEKRRRQLGAAAAACYSRCC